MAAARCRVAFLRRAAFASGRRWTALHEFSSSSKSSDGEFDFLFRDLPSSSQTRSSLKSSIEDGKAETQSQQKKAQGVDEDLFSLISSSTKSAGTSASENAFWKTFSKQTPKRDDWDFVNKLDSGSTTEGPSGDSRRTSFFKGVQERAEGFDFLHDVPQFPTKDSAEPRKTADEHDTSDLSILHSASFKLLRDSFQARESTLGGSPTLKDIFDSQESSSMPSLDTRTLDQVETSFFYSGVEQAQREIKTWSFEELGEKLRQFRPPKEKILSCTTGLSFEELRVRLENIEKMSRESILEDSESEFKEIKESLDVLRAPRVTTTNRFLGDQEMAFVNRTRKQIVYVPPKEHLLEKYYSEEQLSSKEHLKLEIAKLKKEFQMHEHDCGSTQVQIAVLTARINNLNRHLREGPNFRRDKHSRKGFNDMVQYRRRLLIYLRRRDWDTYCNVLTKLNLDDVKQARKGEKRRNVRLNR